MGDCHSQQKDESEPIDLTTVLQVLRQLEAQFAVKLAGLQSLRKLKQERKARQQEEELENWQLFKECRLFECHKKVIKSLLQDNAALAMGQRQPTKEQLAGIRLFVVATICCQNCNEESKLTAKYLTRKYDCGDELQFLRTLDWSRTTRFDKEVISFWQERDRLSESQREELKTWLNQ